MIELKLCPLCAGAAKYVNRAHANDKWISVECKSCNLVMGDDSRRFRTRDDAAKVWNTRV